MLNESDMIPHSHKDERGLNHLGKLSAIAMNIEEMHTLWLNNYTAKYTHHRDMYICAPKHIDLLWTSTYRNIIYDSSN